MYNKQVCQNPQQMAKKQRSYYFLYSIIRLEMLIQMTTSESSSFDFNLKMKILITLKMPFLILSTILDLMISVNYFGNLS